MTDKQQTAKIQRGFSNLTKMIEDVERNGKLYGVPPEAVLAVMVKESYGTQWFCKCDQLYKDNLRAVERISGLTEQEFIRLISIKKGPNRGAIPKFRMEPSWERMANNLTKNVAFPPVWKWRLMCSFGLGQKGMGFHLSAKSHSEWENAFWEFVENPFIQIEVCAHDLMLLEKKTPNDWHSVFTRYNAGPSRYGHTEYSEKVVSLMKRFNGTD